MTVRGQWYAPKCVTPGVTARGHSISPKMSPQCPQDVPKDALKTFFQTKKCETLSEVAGSGRVDNIAPY